MDYFKEYVIRKNYLGLSDGDLFLPEILITERELLLRDIFDNADDYQCCISSLKKVLTTNGVFVFRERFKRFKHAIKVRSKSINTSISSDNYVKLDVKRVELGFKSINEVIDYLLSE